MEIRLAFATAADGTRIAWTTQGDGPALVFMPGVPLSNLEAEWRIPVLARAYTRLARRLRLIQYDGRGTGRSQREVSDLSLDAHLRDLDAVLTAAGVDDVVLLGFYHSVVTAIAWAARHPGRTRGLILFGGSVRGWDPMREPGTQALLSLIERDWDTFVESVAHAWLGWPDDDEGRLAAASFRTTTSPAVARATLRAAAEMDVTADAATIHAPVLVLHRDRAQVIPLEVSRTLAELLPNGRLEILPGSSASLFFEGADDAVDRLTAFALDPEAARPTAASGGVKPGVGEARRARGAGGGSGADGVGHPGGALSPREREVLALIAAGESNGQIAARLGLSINTVERHVSNLYRKIDARGRAEATAWAIRNGAA
jgi:pimeloyl-ACP methyl ester carboxylesterase/DNA-binding CsgD family transcriptional regulator